MKFFKHPTSEVQTKNVGAGTQVWQYSVILKGSRIGKNCNINCHCFIENDVVLGDSVTLKSGVYLWDGITIENNVFVGPNVTFTNDPRPRSRRRPKFFDRTVLKRGSSIGAASVILGGVSVGEYSMVGAGSLVTKNIPPNTLWYGSPAKFKSYICNCGEKLDKKLRCSLCRSAYKLSLGAPVLKK